MALRFWTSIAAIIAASALCLVVAAAQSIPADWASAVAGGHMLFVEKEPSMQDLSYMPFVGNGYLATVINSDTIYVSGLFNGESTSGPSHRARIPTTVRLSVTNPQQLVGSALDMQNGVYYRRTSLSAEIQVEQRWYAHRTRRSILVHEIMVQNPTETAVVVSLTADSGQPSPDITFKQVADAPLQLLGAINTPELQDSQVVADDVPAQVTAPPAANTTFVFVTAIRTDVPGDAEPHAGPLPLAQADYQDARAHADQLLRTHQAAWQDLWQGRVEIGGRLELAQAVNASLYYLLSSLRADWPWSTSPGGLASNAYNGHVFWDAETWMYPPMLLLQRDLAASMLQYRFLHMDGAAAKAQSYHAGYQGLMFPWESAFTGQEVCPSWAPTGALEQHISGDIALAVAQYWWLSGDLQWLTSTGYPILQGVADFWLASNASLYAINGVIPPDEYAVNVSNSAYTNVVAALSLRVATAAAQTLGQQPDPRWAQVADALYVPFDAEQQVHPEFDGYAGQTIKQADVVLLALEAGYPLQYPMSEAVRLADLEYYAARTDPDGPAMTWGMHALALLELGRPADAAALFNRSYANVQPPFDVWFETPKGGAVNFLTGAGGFLQAVLNGYGGVRIQPDHLHLQPQLMEGASLLALRGLRYRDGTLDVLCDAGGITVTQTAFGATVLKAASAATACTLTAQAPSCAFAAGAAIDITPAV